MQFKHPEILYALLLLVIPIIVHLFQLRRFKKVAFTNVKFLKQVELQTRKSSKLKKTLVLLSRLLLFASLITAFAQPFLSTNEEKAPTNTIIYLDNSFSMQAKGDDGELLKRAVQQLIENSSNVSDITLVTNHDTYENVSSAYLKNVLLSIEYDPIPVKLQSVLLRIDRLLSKKNLKSNVFLISDFQENTITDDINFDTDNNYLITKLSPKKNANITIDSVYIRNQNTEQQLLSVVLKKYGAAADEISVSVTNENTLAGRSSVKFGDKNEATVDFTIPNTKSFNGTVSIEDNQLGFDNSFYFSIQKPELIHVTAIGNDTDFLSKIYTEDEFNFISTSENSIDYSSLPDQNLLIINELENIPLSLIDPLNTLLQEGGSVVIVPSIKANLENYNTIFSKLSIGSFSVIISKELAATTINFSHPLLKPVFEKQIKNFQYPTFKSSYNLNLNKGSSLITFENGKNLVTDIPIHKGHVYLFSSALNNKNSNFKSSPLIVPVFYNFGLYSFKPNELYYTIGNENQLEISAQLKKDEVLHIYNETEDFIPIQNIHAKKVTITLQNNPLKSGFANISKGDEVISQAAFNYSRIESDISKTETIENLIEDTKDIIVNTSVNESFTSLTEKYKTTNLWQYFLLLGLLFLVLEILLLKFLKP